MALTLRSTLSLTTRTSAVAELASQGNIVSSAFSTYLSDYASLSMGESLDGGEAQTKQIKIYFKIYLMFILTIHVLLPPITSIPNLLGYPFKQIPFLE